MNYMLGHWLGLEVPFSVFSTDQNLSHRTGNAQVLEVIARGARLRVSHLGSLELVQALAEAYSHYVFAPYVSPHPQVLLNIPDSMDAPLCQTSCSMLDSSRPGYPVQALDVRDEMDLCCIESP